MKARPPGGSVTVEPIRERDKGVGRILRLQSTSITASMTISLSGNAPAPHILPRCRSETKQGASLGLEWKKVRAAMWSGRDNGTMYTVKQRGDATFYVTRGIERSHFGSARSLALAKNMAQHDASGHTRKRKKPS